MIASRSPGPRFEPARLGGERLGAAAGRRRPREKNVASVVSEPGTRIATRVAVARLPSTMAATPWPFGSKNSTCRGRRRARAPASWLSPVADGRAFGRLAIAWASAV